MRIYSQNIEMKSGTEKCTMQVMKSGTEGMEITNRKKIRMFGEKETYKMLGNTGIRHHQTNMWRWEKKVFKVSQKNKEATWNQTIYQDPYKRITYWAFPS